MKYIIKTMIAVMLILFSGCSSKYVKTTISSEENKDTSKFNSTNNYKHFAYKPVIGTKQEDTKLMIDMGQFAKIWVKNYRNKNKTFVSSHHIVTMIKAPGFIAGEDLPNTSRKAVSRTYGRNTFTFRSNDLDYNKDEIKQSELKAPEIKEYLNNVSRITHENKLDAKKEKELSDMDKAILEFNKGNRDDK